MEARPSATILSPQHERQQKASQLMNKSTIFHPCIYITPLYQDLLRLFNVERAWSKPCAACQVLERAGSRIADFKARSWDVPLSSITLSHDRRLPKTLSQNHAKIMLVLKTHIKIAVRISLHANELPFLATLPRCRHLVKCLAYISLWFLCPASYAHQEHAIVC